jgi:phenylalanyl-tRNA synthetase beta chain
MKVSLNWAQYYSNVPLLKDKAKLLDQIGAQLGAIEEIVELGPRYDGIYVVKIISCEPHPNADKLQICTIDDGGATKHVVRDSKGYIQLVCGGTNARAGLLTVWISPGATVPSTIDKEPLVLEVREIRGVPSPGMLATAHELGLSEDSSGLLEIEAEEVSKENTKPGTLFKALYELDDTIVDIENKMFTHRPDCFGILGVARELAGIQHLAFKSRDWYMQEPSFENANRLPVKVQVEDKKLVPRFMAVVIDDIKIGPSPIWMQSYLTRVGIRPINNVVDITNYMMHLTAQPMHAFDYDKIKKLSIGDPVIGPRQAKKGEILTLLGGKKLSLTDQDIVIATDKHAVDLAGIMGGAETEVDSETKAIILTCGVFNMYAIRRATMRHGVFTDAAARNNKGQSPLQVDRIIKHATDDIIRLAGGKVASKTHDIHGGLKTPASVAVSAEFVNTRLGSKLSLKDMAKLLENVEFKIMSVPADKTRLHVLPPFWRTDIEVPEDVVEEIGRLYGYDHLPLVLPRRDITPAKPNRLAVFKSSLRNTLASAGANELLTYSFVHSKLFKNVGQDSKNAYELSNAISPDLQYYRMSLLPSLLDKVHPNIKAGYSEFALFEVNSVHNKDLVDEDKLPIEEQRLGLVFAAEQKAAATYHGAPYYQAKKYLQIILDDLGITAYIEPATSHEPKMAVGKQAIAPFEPSRAGYIKTPDGQLLGEIGEFKTSVRRSLKLPDFIAGFELDVERLLKNSKPAAYKPLSRFPKVEQDITLRVAPEVSHGELLEFITGQTTELAPLDTEQTYSTIDIYQPEDSKNKNVTLRLTITPYQRTLTAGEVNKLLDGVAIVANQKFNAERI